MHHVSMEAVDQAAIPISMMQDASKEQGVAWRGRVAKTFVEAVTQAGDRHWWSGFWSFVQLSTGSNKDFRSMVPPNHPSYWDTPMARYVASEATRSPWTQWFFHEKTTVNEMQGQKRVISSKFGIEVFIQAPQLGFVDSTIEIGI